MEWGARGELLRKGRKHDEFGSGDLKVHIFTMRLRGDMKSIALFFLLLTAMSFYGCAAGIHGTTQDVPVVTDPPGATAKTTNGQACTTPCNLTFQTELNHVVTISKAGL